MFPYQKISFDPARMQEMEKEFQKALQKTKGLQPQKGGPRDTGQLKEDLIYNINLLSQTTESPSAKNLQPIIRRRVEDDMSYSDLVSLLDDLKPKVKEVKNENIQKLLETLILLPIMMELNLADKSKGREIGQVLRVLKRTTPETLRQKDISKIMEEGLTKGAPRRQIRYSWIEKLRLATFNIVHADFLRNIQQTWRAVGHDIKKFIEQSRPAIKRMIEQYGQTPSLAGIVNRGTDKKIILTPEGDLAPAR